LVPPPLGAAVALADAVSDALLDADELELSDFLSDEQPDRPATTIAAPPMATTNPRFTSVLLCFVVTRQDRRIISASMVRRQRDDTRLGEKFAYAPTGRWLRSNEQADDWGGFTRIGCWRSGHVRHHADIAHGR
jgi:hypothetical protein